MTSPRSIDDILACIALPGVVIRIDDERPAFHTPMVDDHRLAYFLAGEGCDPVRLVESLDHSLTAAGFELEYCEKNDFYYRGPLGNLQLHLDSSPDGMSARFDVSGRPVEVSQTWHHIPAGRLVITFAV